MYRAKARARGGTEFFAPRLRTELLRRVALSTALETAVRDGELEVRYQPIVSITDGRILALEALVRWLHPMWGWVQPDEFIPLAEQNGMIVALGRYVLGAVASQIAQWRQEQPGTLPLGVFINASPQELSSPEFVPFVAETLRGHGLTHSDIAVELTEQAFISQANGTLIKNLAELTKIGVHIVLDDFGTGYSALASLRRFPLAALKIDRVFIQSIRTPDDQAPLASAIIGLGKALGMIVIAEGVERHVQLDYLRRLGCDAAQGFLLARPRRASEVSSLLSASVHPHGR
jgi:EAL domain-containing protein (putative c-di-GMP-specific phosphodiesterase class I)